MQQVFALVILFAGILASAASAAEMTLSIQDAITVAMKDNHELKAYGHAVSAQQQEIGIARSFLLPKISFEERFLRTNNPPTSFMIKLNQERFAASDFAVSSLNNPSPINDFQTSLSFEQPIFIRKATIGLDMSRQESAAKGEEYARKREELALRVFQAYLMVRTAKEFEAVSEKAVEDSKEHLRIAEARYHSGLGLYSDTLRASTAVTEAEQREVAARKNLSVVKRSLGLLLGMSESVDITGDPPRLSLREIGYYTDASLSRKDVAAMEKRYENSKNSVKLAQSAYLPFVGAGGSYQLNDHRRPFGSEGDSWQLMAFLRWELFDGTKREHEITKARYKAAETAEYLEGFRKAVSYKVYEAFAGVKEAEKNAELARSAHRTAEEGKRLVRIRYEKALSPLVDLLDAQTSLDHTRANLVASENAYRLAIANLSYESGTIMKDLNIEE